MSVELNEFFLELLLIWMMIRLLIDEWSDMVEWFF